MSIVKPCPYDINGEHCKYEIYYGEPIFSKCKNCSRTRTIFKRCIEMTDKEMAEEYADRTRIVDENTKAGTDCISLVQDYEGNVIDIHERIKQAFLAGLKAGRPEWHKVADGDLPPREIGNYTINILTDRGYIAYYSYTLNCWIAEPSSVEIDTPIAWCEIPKYTEE